jgi:hypothetical protein
MHYRAHILALLMKLVQYVQFNALFIAHLYYALFWETC